MYGPYLLQLEPEQLAVLTMHRWAATGGRPSGTAHALVRCSARRRPARAAAAPCCRSRASFFGAMQRHARHRLPWSPSPQPCSVINAIVATEEAGGGAFSSPGQARVTRLSLAIGKVRGSRGWVAAGAVQRRGERGQGQGRVAGCGCEVLGRTVHHSVGPCSALPLCTWRGLSPSLTCDLSTPSHPTPSHPTHPPTPTSPPPPTPPTHPTHPPHLPPPPLLLRQAVEAQVNLDKLQVEAHKHNLVRREVKELYQRVSLPGPAPRQSCWLVWCTTLQAMLQHRLQLRQQGSLALQRGLAGWLVECGSLWLRRCSPAPAARRCAAGGGGACMHSTNPREGSNGGGGRMTWWRGCVRRTNERALQALLAMPLVPLLLRITPHLPRATHSKPPSCPPPHVHPRRAGGCASCCSSCRRPTRRRRCRRSSGTSGIAWGRRCRTWGRSCHWTRTSGTA